MDNNNIKIRICLGSSCFSRGNEENLEIIQKFLKANEIAADIDFRGHLCEEACQRGPVFSINEKLFEEVHPANVEKILNDVFTTILNK